MRDYRCFEDGDIKALTVEDALADDDFGKSPWDYFQYIAIEQDQVENILDATDLEVGQAFKAISTYCKTGCHPEYSSFSSSGVKMLVRSIIHAHEKRMNSEYIRHYRQFVAAQKKAQEKTLGKLK